MVELVGIEPTTSSLRKMRSSITPRAWRGLADTVRSKTVQSNNNSGLPGKLPHSVSGCIPIVAGVNDLHTTGDLGMPHIYTRSQMTATLSTDTGWKDIQLGKLKNEVSKPWPVLRFCNLARAFLGKISRFCSQSVPV